MPKSAHLSIEHTVKHKAKVSVDVPMQIIREPKRYIAHCDALDLSTYGKTQAEATKRMKEVIELFFEEIMERGTVHEALAELGWTHKKEEWIPPVVIKHTIMIPARMALAA